MKFVLITLILSLCSFTTHSRSLLTETVTNIYELIPCLNDSDCSDLENAKCENNICKCLSAESRVCSDLTTGRGQVVNKLEDSHCRTNADCRIEHSVCGDNKKCVCSGDTISSSDRRKCIKISTSIGDFCKENVQCTTKQAFTECRGNKCVCQRHMHENNSSCHRNVGLGGSCVENEECSLIGFSSCVNTKCACVDEYVTSGHRCVPISKGLGSNCTEDVQCTVQLGTGSHCFNRTCQCKDLYQPLRDKCVRDVLLGELCDNSNECHQPGPELSRLECILGVCKCNSLYVEYEGYCISTSSKITLRLNYFYFIVLYFLCAYL